MADVNWDAVKAEYITTDIGQRKLAEKYNAPIATLIRRCAAEGWVEARKRYKSDVMAKTLKKTANREAGKLAKLIQATENLMEVAELVTADPNQFRSHVVETRERYAEPIIEEDDEGNTVAIAERQWSEVKLLTKYDSKQIKDMTAVLKDLTAVARDLYELPTQAQAEQQRVAAERLKLEQGKAKEDGAREIRVTFNGGGKESWME